MLIVHDRHSMQEIKQREEKNPDDVHEMPVQPGVLELHERITRDLVPRNKHEHDAQDHDADNDVERMKPRHHEVEAEVKNDAVALLQ